jgi:hypothetical protein
LARCINDAVERAMPAFVPAVSVVQRARPVHADTHQEAILAQEFAPLTVQQNAIGLDCMLNLGVRLPIAFCDLDRPPAKVETHKGWLAALPGNDNFRRGVRLDGLAHIAFHHLIGHAEVTARIEGLLGKKEAVSAIEIAGCARGLRHHVKARTPCRSPSETLLSAHRRR